MKSRRGSLDISINSIVVIVLAFTFLALALTFIKGVFQGATELPQGALETIQGRLRQELVQTGNKIALEVVDKSVAKNSYATIAFGVNNNKDDTLSYRVEIYEVGQSAPTESKGSAGGINLPSGGGFQWDSDEQTLAITGDDSSKVDTLKYFSPPTAGSYQYKVVLWDTVNNEEYASKSFFVDVS